MKHKQSIKSVLLITVIMLCMLIPTTIQAQKTKAVLTFKNGTVKTGLGKLLGGNKIKFRVNKNRKATKYDFNLLKQVKIYNQTDIITYVSVKIKDKEKPNILEQVVLGRVTLYQKTSMGYNPGMGGVGFGGTGFSTGYSYNINNFYVKKEGDTEAFHLGSNQLFTKNFKQAASDYFKDCPLLVKKIQNRTFKKKDLRAIVEFYNNECH
ncbi:hypothetical protein [Thalassobellus citreus]|uniref:hypothetical protein n=1 Tax=Thalassobellus citreus TaxID=3367752 RepID=UPI0037BAE286